MTRATGSSRRRKRCRDTPTPFATSSRRRVPIACSVSSTVGWDITRCFRRSSSRPRNKETLMTSTSASGVRAPGIGGQTVYTGITPARGRGLVAAYLGITALVLALLMVFGLLMKASQAGIITIPPTRFYQLLTAHGIGMVAISGLGGAGVLWYFLTRYVELSPAILLANLACFLIGVVLVLGGIFIGGFAAGWTFLFPLPAHSQGVWGAGAAASYLVGVLVVGVGFLLLFLDTGR